VEHLAAPEKERRRRAGEFEYNQQQLRMTSTAIFVQSC